MPRVHNIFVIQSYNLQFQWGSCSLQKILMGRWGTAWQVGQFVTSILNILKQIFIEIEKKNETVSGKIGWFHFSFIRQNAKKGWIRSK